MKILSEAQLIRDGWVKDGAVWHSPVRKLPEEIVESTPRAAEVKRAWGVRCKDRREYQTMSVREDLIAGFMALGLDRHSAEIAAAGSSTNPQNNQQAGQSHGMDMSLVMEPYGT
jgi:hypothetical protein